MEDHVFLLVEQSAAGGLLLISFQLAVGGSCITQPQLFYCARVTSAGDKEYLLRDNINKNTFV